MSEKTCEDCQHNAPCHGNRTKELEPCPFCGSNSSIRTDILMFTGLVKAIVECDGCDVYIVSYGKTKDEAIQKASELWNTRYKRTCHIDETGCATGICSACGGEFCASVCTNEPPDYVKGALFCPNCGAEVVDD